MKTKGTTVRSIKNQLLEMDKEVYNKWFDSLSEEAKNIFSSKININNMYSMDILKEASEKAALLLDMDLNKFSYSNAVYSVEVAMNGFLKIISTVSSLKFIFTKTQTFLKSYFDFGETRLLKATNTNASFLVYDIPTEYEFIIWRMYGWMTKIIEIKSKELINKNITILEPQNNLLRTQFDYEYKL